MYGYERVKKELISVGGKTTKQIIEHFNNSAQQWAGKKEPEDDITFMVIKIK
jgi:hypothetical protein